jgi:hypothetical protein
MPCKTSWALEAPRREVRDAVRQAPFKNVDVISRKCCGELTCLWLATTHGAGYFSLRGERSGHAPVEWPGGGPDGVNGSHRSRAYGGLPGPQCHVCWDHTMRDPRRRWTGVAGRRRSGRAADPGGLIARLMARLPGGQDRRAGAAPADAGPAGTRPGGVPPTGAEVRPYQDRAELRQHSAVGMVAVDAYGGAERRADKQRGEASGAVAEGG